MLFFVESLSYFPSVQHIFVFFNFGTAGQNIMDLGRLAALHQTKAMDIDYLAKTSLEPVPTWGRALTTRRTPKVQREITTEVPYFPVYKAHLCISRTPLSKKIPSLTSYKPHLCISSTPTHTYIHMYTQNTFKLI